MELLIDRHAPTEHLALGDGRSWVEVVRAFVPAAALQFDALFEQAAWQQAEVLRYDRYVPEKRLGAALLPGSQPAFVRQAGLHLDARYKVHFDGASALLYRNGSDFQGLHRDREMRWLDDTLVAIVVLGERRPFVFRERGASAQAVDRTPAGTRPGDIVLTPGDGDLLVMGGRCQRDWLHGVPACQTAQPRISVTWRWTSRQGRPDTNPSYFDGRQFSDASRQRGYRTRR